MLSKWDKTSDSGLGDTGGPWSSRVTFLLSLKLDQSNSFKEIPHNPRACPWCPLTEDSWIPGAARKATFQQVLPDLVAPGRDSEPGCFAPRFRCKITQSHVNTQVMWGPKRRSRGGGKLVEEEGDSPERVPADGTLTFFILKDSSSSFSTARMFSMGML